jgi:hypothetical protein
MLFLTESTSAIYCSLSCQTCVATGTHNTGKQQARRQSKECGIVTLLTSSLIRISELSKFFTLQLLTLAKSKKFCWRLELPISKNKADVFSYHAIYVNTKST